MIGESDGAFPTAAQQVIFTTNAPAAGTWWQEWFDDFVGHSDIANTSVDPITTPDLYTDTYFDTYGQTANPPAPTGGFGTSSFGTGPFGA